MSIPSSKILTCHCYGLNPWCPNYFLRKKKDEPLDTVEEIGDTSTHA